MKSNLDNNNAIRGRVQRENNTTITAIDAIIATNTDGTIRDALTYLVDEDRRQRKLLAEVERVTTCYEAREQRDRLASTIRSHDNEIAELLDSLDSARQRIAELQQQLDTDTAINGDSDCLLCNGDCID